jgi:hypothetical protein
MYGCLSWGILAFVEATIKKKKKKARKKKKKKKEKKNISLPLLPLTNVIFQQANYNNDHDVYRYEECIIIHPT